MTHPVRAPLGGTETPVLLVNPFARKVSRPLITHIAAQLRLGGRAILEVGRDGTVRTLSARAVRSRVPYVLAAGGDGTLHHIVQELANTGTALGILPCGTSNDLATDVGIPGDIRAALATIAGGRIAEVDLLRIGRHRVATAGGFGLPAAVARRCNELRTGPHRHWFAPLGPAIYSTVAAELICRRAVAPVTFTLGTNGTGADSGRACAILVSRVAKFGGGLQLMPQGTLKPGTFVAVVIRATTRSGLMHTLLRLRLGMPPGRRAKTYVDLTRLDVRANALVDAFGDGEWLGLHRQTRITVEPKALRVLVPCSHRSGSEHTLRGAA